MSVCRAKALLTDRRTCWQRVTDKVAQFNHKLRGWANYFSLGTVIRAFDTAMSHTCRRLRRWQCYTICWNNFSSRSALQEGNLKRLGLMKAFLLRIEGAAAGLKAVLVDKVFIVRPAVGLRGAADTNHGERGQVAGGQHERMVPMSVQPNGNVPFRGDAYDFGQITQAAKAAFTTMAIGQTDRIMGDEHARAGGSSASSRRSRSRWAWPTLPEASKARKLPTAELTADHPGWAELLGERIGIGE